MGCGRREGGVRGDIKGCSNRRCEETWTGKFIIVV